ncbi:GGDEF domain-containing protein [Silvimonas amylolytica]|uniref:diguanylate cyclase n=1 Tax=Silvimonas amylolytica TaxID=449663 RepID=A0ABQ2PKT0_9NEIS|nr:GGDEF domain-containing protein [Silvimonas amylolytica]GGP26233.1 GGDEF domain-containing protein [Silvimonas amylolytica]
MSFTGFHRLAMLLMLLLSVLLMAWQHWGMDRVLYIDARSGYPISVVSDGDNQKDPAGYSQASYQPEDHRMRMDCTLTTRYEWPYCELDVQLAKAPEGIDLADYDRVDIKLDYQGPGRRQVRFLARNFDPLYSKLDTPETWKNNLVSFTPKTGGEIISIPFELFSVAEWWLDEHHIPLQQSAVDLHNVPMISVTTAGFKEPGLHRVSIDYIAFHGKWISREKLATLLVLCWIILSASALIQDQTRLNRSLAESRERERSLRDLADTLHLEKIQISEQAQRDPLTGIRNRAGVLEELLRASEQARHTGKPLAMVFVDIDHFKAVNDTHGHEVGDMVLKQFAQLLGTQIRAGDYLVRWGGEELVLFFPNATLETATSRAERMRQSLTEVIWPAGMRITASFGVTVMGMDEQIAQFIRRADDALYEAKRNGRNRVVNKAPGEASGPDKHTDQH